MVYAVRIELNSKQRADGRRLIFIRLTKNKRMKRISTGIYATKKNFDVNSKYGSWVKKSDPQYLGKNRVLKEAMFKAESAPSELERKGLLFAVISLIFNGLFLSFFYH